MLVVIGCQDRYLGNHLSEIITEAGKRSIRTGKIDRIIKELKQPDRVLVVDLNWEDVQEHGVLRQLVNLAKICANKVICVCPNQEEELKKLSKMARPDEMFLRYDLETTFKDYIKEL